MCGQVQNHDGSRVKLPNENINEIPQWDGGVFESINCMIGKEVYIYPGDAHKKKGIIIDMNAHGVLFKITMNDDQSTWKSYEVGKMHFIAYSAKLSFREV